jgi:AraC family transcriptional regulator
MQLTQLTQLMQRMHPPTVPPPSLLPYLSSAELGWDGLQAQAFHELAEVEECIAPGKTDISLSLLTGGGQRWEMREMHTQAAWEGVLLRPGDLVLGAGTNVPWVLRWRNTSSAPTYSFNLRLSRNLLVRMVEELVGGDGMRLMLVDQGGFQDPFLMQVVLSLWRELREGAPSGKLFAECAAQMIMLHLLRFYARSGKVAATIQEPTHRLSPQQLHRVSAYISDHSNQDLTLEVLAQQAGFSPFHFARLFRKTTGVTPHQYVRRERLAHARRLLESTRLSLAEVALESGFGDQSYFTRVFKGALRVTPAAYRRERTS